MELSVSNIKKFLIFSYTSGNRNPEKNYLCFKKTLKKLLVFREIEFFSSPQENFLFSGNGIPEKTAYKIKPLNSGYQNA